MLQLRRLSHAALEAISSVAPFPPAWRTLPELRQVADHWCARLLDERSALARGQLGAGLWDSFDRSLRTDRLEYLDRAEFPPEERLGLVRSLHKLNRVLGTYQRCFRLLEPLIRAITARTRRPARLLELASGFGEFSLGLAPFARRAGLSVEVTGSDYIPEYVRDAERRATARGNPARFRVLDAFDFASSCTEGEFDLVFIAQSLHHFTPGQLALMIAQARRVATEAFVGMDGLRSLRVLTVFPVLALSALDRHFLHDAVISARKFYSHAELSLLGRIAAPDARVETSARQPGFSVLTVRWGGN